MMFVECCAVMYDVFKECCCLCEKSGVSGGCEFVMVGLVG